MDNKLLFKKNNFNKRGLSTIVVTLILIALSMAAIVLVWGVANNMIQGQIKKSQACFGNYDKVSLNGQYTCYHKIDATHYTLRFSLSLGDVEVEKVLAGVASSDGTTRSYAITNTAGLVSGLKMYPSGAVNVVLPAKNAGLTYETDTFNSKIDSISIAPVIGGTQCGVADSIPQIEDCVLVGFG